MQSSYILRNKNNEILYFYYGDEKSIYYKKYENGYLRDSVKIIEQVSDNFTVSFYKTGEIYLICQTLDRDIVLCKEENDGFIQRTLFKNEPIRRYRTFFQTLVNENGMTLVYNTPMENSRNELLVKRHIGYEQKWSAKESIDSFLPFNLSLFKTQKIKDDYMIILYQKKERENLLGYREITQNKVTSFNIFHKTAYQITDQTFLATDNTIHFLYIIKSIFSSQIIYRKRDKNGLSRPIVIYEGTKVRSCSLYIIKNTLYATWVIGSSLFFSTSNDNGETFYNSSKNSRWISPNSRKVEFISFNKMQESQFIFNEVYIDENEFTNIQFIREEYSEFFNTTKNDNNNTQNNRQNFEILPTNQFKQNVLQDNFLSNFDTFFMENTQQVSNVKTNDKPTQNFNVFTPNQQNVLQDNFLSNFEDSIESFFVKNMQDQKSFYNNFDSNIKNKLAQNSNNSSVNNVLSAELNHFDNFDGFKYFETPPSKDELMQVFNNYSLNNKISTLQNKLNIAETRLSEKNKQISELNNIIQIQNNEKVQEEARLKEQVKMLEEENYKIKEEYTFCEKDGGTEIEDDESEQEEF